MAKVFDINTDKFTLLQEIERLRHCLSQYETLLGIKPFDKELLKGDKGDKGDRGKALYYTDLTPEQITELQRPAADMIAELTVLQEELNRVETLRQQAEELRVQKNQEAILNAIEAKNLAIEVVEHPPVIVNDVWRRWNFETNSYETIGARAKGDSAYQIWLEAGNTGTLEDYLEDIKGDTGNYGVVKFVVNDNMELEQHTLSGDPLDFSIVDGDLILNEAGETVNLGVVANKDTYSYDEQRIGTWVNGKPIYRKVILLEAPIEPSIDIVINHNLNIDTYIRMDIASNIENSEIPPAIPLINGSLSSPTTINADRNEIIIYSADLNLFSFSLYLILEYTKLP